MFKTGPKALDSADRAWLLVECPTCAAPPDARCVRKGTTAFFLMSPHAVRRTWGFVEDERRRKREDEIERRVRSTDRRHNPVH